VRHHFHLVIARVNGGLEKLNLLVGKLRTADPAEQLLGFARKHGSANHFYPTFFVVPTGFVL
jgi:hypothetical protein